jgi:nucleoside-diphosphate-sugar epimerase
VREVAEFILEATGHRSEIEFLPPRSGDLMRLCADSSKIREELGWSPQVPLATGLAWNIEWFEKVAGDQGSPG